METGRLVGGREEPNAGGPKPNAISPLIVVDSVTTNAVNQQRPGDGGYQQERRKPTRQTAFRIDIERCHQRVAGCRLPTHPCVRGFEAGDDGRARDEERKQGKKPPRNQVEKP